MAIFLFLSFVSSISPLLAGSKTSADFLKIPVGAQISGLGQATTALPLGAHSLNGNVAGLAGAPLNRPRSSFGVAFSRQDQFLGTSLDQIGMTTPSRKKGFSFGLNIVRLSYATQEKRDADRQSIGSFDSSDLSAGLAIAKDFGSYQLGTQIKMIRMELAGYSSQGAAFDLGLLSRTPWSQLSAGLSVRNLGPKMKFISEEFDLPLTLSGGLAYNVMGPLSLSLDVQSRPYQDQLGVSIGSDFLISKSISLRAGYLAKLSETIQTNQPSESSRGSFSGLNGLAGGFGLRFNQFSIDYSITPFGELGNSQSFTIASWFGGTQSSETTTPTVETENNEKASSPSEDNRDILILPDQNKSWWDKPTK